jgi:hypothetical protein
MKREECDSLWGKLISGCPDQREGNVSWAVGFDHRGRAGIRFSVDTLDCMSSAQLCRLAAIKEAGERWERNEGPWPMAKGDDE